MPVIQIDRLLPADGSPAPWAPPVTLRYTRRDVLLYAVGIGCRALHQVYEGAPGFAVFPTFAIRWGGVGLQVDAAALPHSPGPLLLDAERQIEQLHPLPLPAGDDEAVAVQVRTRLIALQPRNNGAAFMEVESEVSDAAGRVCLRLVTGLFRRGVERLGDLVPFEGRGTSRSVKLTMPDRAPDVQVAMDIPAEQATVYRLSGDYNPLHIDPEAARRGGFELPILHGLCTLGHCAQGLLGALAGSDAARFSRLRLRFSSPVYPGERLTVLGWHAEPAADGSRQTLFEAQAGTGATARTVVSHGAFGWRA